MNAKALREYHKPEPGSRPVERPMDKADWQARADAYSAAAAYLILKTQFESEVVKKQACYVSDILRRDAERCRLYGAAVD